MGVAGGTRGVGKGEHFVGEDTEPESLLQLVLGYAELVNEVFPAMDEFVTKYFCNVTRDTLHIGEGQPKSAPYGGHFAHE